MLITCRPAARLAVVDVRQSFTTNINCASMDKDFALSEAVAVQLLFKRLRFCFCGASGRGMGYEQPEDDCWHVATAATPAFTASEVGDSVSSHLCFRVKGPSVRV